MILVLGATGNIGSEVVKQLATSGVPVRAFVRDVDKAEALRAPNVEFGLGDLDRLETLYPALEDVVRLFLLTPADPQLVEQQGHILEAARRAGVRHVVQLSVLGASLDSPVAIARWHAQCERQLEESGLAYTHLRPHYFMQNLLGFAASVRGDAALYAPMHEGRIALVDTRDVAAVAAVVLGGSGHEGSTYDITGPEALSFSDLARTISSVTLKRVTYKNVSPQEARLWMLDQGTPEWLADSWIAMYGLFGSGRSSTVTNTVAELTGAQPRTFAQFAREHAWTFGA